MAGASPVVFFASEICCADVQMNIKDEIVIALTYLAVYVYLKLFSFCFFSSFHWLVVWLIFVFLLCWFCSKKSIFGFFKRFIWRGALICCLSCQHLLEKKNGATDNWKPSICLWGRQCNTRESRRERFFNFIYHLVSKCCFVNSQIR